MSKTALAEKLAGAGATLGEYRGVETAAHFGDVTAEFNAILSGCAVQDIGWRGCIRATGEDRVRWLNGMVTNNVKDLAVGEGNYNFLLSAQGKIQGDLWVYRREEELMLETDRNQISKLQPLLDHFIIMDDVELTELDGNVTALAVMGPLAETILRAAGLPTPEARGDKAHVVEAAWNGTVVGVTRMPMAMGPIFTLWLGAAHAWDLWQALRGAGARPAGFEALERYRVLAGIPRYGVDITEKFIPQETGQTQALHFSKGCYLGQEIVERVRSRGAVHREFTGFVFEGKVEPGVEVTLKTDGKKAGEVTSVAPVPMNVAETYLALGYFRREAGGPGTPVSAGAINGVTSALPFRS